jgi:outer membrane protein TolC
MSKSIRLILLLCLYGINASTQIGEISLDSSLKLAYEFYPMINQLGLIQSSESYTVSNLSKSWWPQFSLNAQATYQSDVTHISVDIPNLPLPAPPPKDQYKATLDVTQWIYDGGQIAAQKNIARTNSKIEIIRTQTELYKIKERIQQLFFGNLLLQSQIKNLELTASDISEQLKKAKASYDARTIPASSYYSLQAEQIKNQQRIEELLASRRQWLQMLSRFLNKQLDENTNFVLPSAPAAKNELQRIEPFSGKTQITGIRSVRLCQSWFEFFEK